MFWLCQTFLTFIWTAFSFVFVVFVLFNLNSFSNILSFVLGFVLEGSCGWWVLRFISSPLRSYCKLLASPTHGLDISLSLSVCCTQVDLLSFEVSMDYFGILRFITYPVVSVSFFLQRCYYHGALVSVGIPYQFCLKCYRWVSSSSGMLLCVFLV